MIKNYLKIALRNILRNKLIAGINIAGMTIGMASFIIISLFVWSELQYDQYYPDKETTYRLYNVRTSEDGSVGIRAIVPPTFAPQLKQDYPEIKSTLRIMNPMRDLLLNIEGNKSYISNSVYAEPSVIDMLALELIHGDENTALGKPYHLLMSEKLAKTIYDDANPVGELIELSGDQYTVAGVYRDMPDNSHLDFPLIVSFSTFSQFVPEDRMNSWSWQQFHTYIKFDKPIDEAVFEGKLEAFAKEYAHPVTKERGYTYIPHIQNISDIYLNSEGFEWDIAKIGSINTVYALMASALFIIIIVCINFINLSITHLMTRVKEIGIRKTIGAERKQIVYQFIGESILMALISVLLAGFIGEIALRYVNEFTGKEIDTMLLRQPMSTFGMLLFALVIGTMAGLYPSLYASHIKPVSILGGEGVSRKLNFRNTMVVVQFALSTFLIIISIVVYQQNSFLRETDLGFDKEHVVTFQLRSGLRKNLETTKNLFLENPNILSATYSYGLPGDIVAGDLIIDPVANREISANQFLVDFDYIKTLGLELVAGRDFSIDRTSDVSEGFIINETAVRNLGFGTPEQAIDKPLAWNMWHYDSVKNGRVIGVVKDFHFKSMREEISTSVLQIYPRSLYKMALRVKGDNLQETIGFIKDTWNKLESEYPITYSFIDDDFDKMYENEEKMSKMITVFTALGILIACFGLFGLISHDAKKRYKEIGIRKVLGANVLQIVKLVTKGYVALLLVSFAISIPIGHYVVSGWLSGFAYRIEVGPIIYLLAVLGVLTLALGTVCFQSIKAGLTNPVDSLKEE